MSCAGWAGFLKILHHVDNNDQRFRRDQGFSRFKLFREIVLISRHTEDTIESILLVR